jgi:hypothetical protein
MYWTIVRIAATALFIFVGAQFGINALAFSLLVLNFVVNPLFWRITIKPMVQGRYRDYFANSILICLLVMVISAPFYLLFYNLTTVWLCILIGVGYVLVYTIIVYLVYPKSYLVTTVKNRVLPRLIKKQNNL